MRNHSVLPQILLLVYGVFGQTVRVSVMEGDSVTLNPDAQIQRNDELKWKFGDEIIARMKEADGSLFIRNGTDGRFTGRLKLEYDTGSLTVTNMGNKHSGLYHLQIRNTNINHKTFNVSVRDIVESVSVMEGDSVTLHTGVTGIQTNDMIQWFDDQDLIARLNGPVHSRWTNIHLNDQNGDLNITNIRKDQSGDYKMKINTIKMILHKKIHIAVDEVKSVSVMEGQSVILRTGLLKIQEFAEILWTFGDHPMGEINARTNRFSLFPVGGRFEGRLQPDHQTGSLTISKSRASDSADYHLTMSSSTHTIQRTISVTVSESDLHSNGACVAGWGLMIGAVTVFLTLLLL